MGGFTENTTDFSPRRLHERIHMEITRTHIYCGG